MTRKYMIRLYRKNGSLFDTWYADKLKDAETIRKEWAAVNGITEFVYMPTIWKRSRKTSNGYERILGY